MGYTTLYILTLAYLSSLTTHNFLFTLLQLYRAFAPQSHPACSCLRVFALVTPSVQVLWWGRSFIEIYFAYCTIHPYKMYNSMLFLVYSQACANITTINFRTFCPHQDILSHSSFSLIPLKPQTTINLSASIIVFLFWTFHVEDAITQYMIFVTDFSHLA